jgi:hypothetical protein
MEENKKENKIVQTYAEDMARVIGDNTQGLVKKIIHGEEEHEEEKKNLSPESKQNKIFMIVGFILLFLSLATLAYFVFFKKDLNTVAVEQQFVPIIFTDKNSFLEIAGFNKDEITQTVFNQANNTKVKTGGIEGVYLTENKQIVGLREFISLIKSTFAPDENPLLVNDNFLMGVVNDPTEDNSSATYPTTKDFFILIKIRSIADIFDTMRSWENKMFYDLHGFFGVKINSDTGYLLTKDFENNVIENKNARILYDKDGQIVISYLFADDNSLIITNSIKATREIMLRLASAKKKQ